MSFRYLHIIIFLDPNPHMGHLAWADAFVVTADSVSMLSEACSTGYFSCLDVSYHLRS